MVSTAKPTKFGRMKLHPATVLRHTGRSRSRPASGSLRGGAGALTIVAIRSPALPGGVPGARRAHHHGLVLRCGHWLRTVFFAWSWASVMAASMPLLLDRTAECRVFSRFCRPTVYLDTGFSGLVVCLDQANFDRSSVGTPASEKYACDTSSEVFAGVMPIPASALAAVGLAAYSRNAFATAILSPSVRAALMAMPVGSPKVTGVLEVPAVLLSNWGAGAMPQLKVFAS